MTEIRTDHGDRRRRRRAEGCEQNAQAPMLAVQAKLTRVEAGCQGVSACAPHADSRLLPSTALTNSVRNGIWGKALFCRLF